MRNRRFAGLLAIWFLLGYSFAPLMADTPEKADAKAKAEEEDYYELYLMLADAMDQVERNYVTEISRRELMEAAIEGVISKLDQYSSYIKPEELDQFRTSVDSEFGGIGIQISIESGRLTVSSPLVGSPAYRAGLRAGDKIIKIEDESTDGFTLADAVRRLKGKEGTTVTVTIQHPGEPEPEVVELTREVIRVKTVLGDRRKEDDAWDFFYDRDKQIGYVRLSAFSRDTAKELREALRELTKDKLNGLIVDLRFNPGGLLSSAIEISDLFVSKGLIVSTEGRNTKKRVWEAHEAGTFEGFPMAVLVNRYSASASEILSGCLQDHKRAVIIGERTWGKGSVQNVVELEAGKSALKLTTAGYQRPSGKNIHRFPDAQDKDEWGVKPDDGYEVRLSDEEMGHLIRDRRDRDVVGFHAHRPFEEGAPPEPREPEEQTAKPFVDQQLQKALGYLSQEMARAE